MSGNPYYPVALADNYRTNGLDPARADNLARMGDVERAGISYAFHSDMPMAPGQPLFLMWTGVNRITNDGNLRGPEQRVSRLGALKAVALDAAHSLQLEKDVGSIVPGKLAKFRNVASGWKKGIVDKNAQGSRRRIRIDAQTACSTPSRN